MQLPLGEGTKEPPAQNGFLGQLPFLNRLSREQRILVSVLFWVIVLLAVAISVFQGVKEPPLLPEEETALVPEKPAPAPVSAQPMLHVRDEGRDAATLSVEACNRLGRTAQQAGQHKEAIQFFELARQKVEAEGAEGEPAWEEYASSLATLGHLCFDRTPQDCACAIGYYKQALLIARARNFSDDPRYVMVAKRQLLCE